MATATDRKSHRRAPSWHADGGVPGGSTTSYELSRPQEILAYLLPSLAALGGQLEGIGQIFAFRLAVIVYLFLTVIHLRRRAVRSAALPRYVLVMSWIWVVMALFLSVVHGLPSSGWTEAASVGFGLILVNCVFMGPLSSRTLRVWLRGWALAVAVEVFIGAWEVLTNSHMPNYYLYNLNVPEWAVADSVAGSLGNPNAYAFFLVASMPLLGLAWYLNKDTKTRWVYLTLIVLSIILLTETGSRLSWIAFGMVAAMWLFTRNGGLRAIAVFLVSSAILVAVVAPDEVSTLLGLNSSGTTAMVTGDASIQVRWNLLLNGLAFTSETGLLGLGPGGFEVRMRGDVPYATGGIQSAHSGAIEILAQYGVVVFVAVVLLLLWLTIEGVRGARRGARHGELRELSVALIIGTVALVPLSFTNSSTLDLSFTWTYLLMLCLMGSEVARRRRLDVGERAMPGGRGR